MHVCRYDGSRVDRIDRWVHSLVNFNKARNAQPSSGAKSTAHAATRLIVIRGMLRASKGHGHESHIIFASHFRTLGRSIRRGSARQRDRSRPGRALCGHSMRNSQRKCLHSLRGVHNYIDSLYSTPPPHQHHLDTRPYQEPNTN